jgi:rhodanese-related sulfurtransferase
VCGFVFVVPRCFSQQSLSVVERIVARTYAVPEVQPETLLRQMQKVHNDTSLVLFDVREKAEFDKSHIRGALWVKPDWSADSVFAHYGSALHNKRVVMYCSVGYRSGAMVEKLADSLQQRGCKGYNLRGGIFSWYNLGYTVVANDAPIDVVHPYDNVWGRLVVPRTKQ